MENVSKFQPSRQLKKWLPRFGCDSHPVAIGFGGGAVMLGGLLAGVTASGVLMALFQSNAGGAWDNAKKMVEEGYEMGGVNTEKARMYIKQLWLVTLLATH